MKLSTHPTHHTSCGSFQKVFLTAFLATLIQFSSVSYAEDSWFFRSEVIPNQSMWGPGSNPINLSLSESYYVNSGIIKGTGIGFDLQMDSGTVSGNVEGKISANYAKIVRGTGSTQVKFNYSGLDNESQINTFFGVKAKVNPRFNVDFPWYTFIPSIDVSLPISAISRSMNNSIDFNGSLGTTTFDTHRMKIVGLNQDWIVAEIGTELGINQRFTFTPESILGKLNYRHEDDETGKNIIVKIPQDGDLGLTFDVDLDKPGRWDFSLKDFTLSENTFSQQFGVYLDLFAGLPPLGTEIRIISDNSTLGGVVDLGDLIRREFSLGFLNHNDDGNETTSDFLGRFSIFVDDSNSPFVSTSGNVSEVISGETNKQITGNLIIGHTNSNSGDMTVYNGGSISNKNGYIGLEAGSNGSSIISGTGSKWENDGDLFVGHTGKGALRVEDSGEVSSNNVIYIGLQTGSEGSVTVTDPGSILKVKNAVGNALLYVGSSGTADLSIQNAATVESDTGAIGSFNWNGGGTGTVTVSGVNSRWNNTARLDIGSNGPGTGTLNIEKGGEVYTGTTYLGSITGIGTEAGSGSLLVTGAGSLFNSSGSLYIGGNESNAKGSGVISVKDNAKLNISQDIKIWDAGILNLDGGSVSTKNFDASAGTFNHNDGSLTVKDGKYTFFGHSDTLVVDGAKEEAHLILDNAVQGEGYFFVDIGGAGNGAGKLTVTGGTSLVANQLLIATAENSKGMVTVDGIGSHIKLNYRGVSIGDRGEGSLLIQNGGVVELVGNVSAGTTVGNYAKGDGNVTVTGQGSKLLNGDGINIGLTGLGVVNIENAGLLTTGKASHLGYIPGILGEVTVSGKDSRWEGSGALYVAKGGTGRLKIEDGGWVSNTNAFIASDTGSIGEVTVEGNASKWISNGSLMIGGTANAGGEGLLTIKDGGLVSVNGNVKLWDTGHLVLNGGELQFNSLDSDLGEISWGKGTMTYLHDRAIDSNITMISGQTLNIRNNLMLGTNSEAILKVDTKSLVNVENTFSIGSKGLLNLAGGELKVGKFALNNGNFNWTSGKLTITKDFSIGEPIIVPGSDVQQQSVTSLNRADLQESFIIPKDATFESQGKMTLEGNGKIILAGGSLMHTNAQLELDGDNSISGEGKILVGSAGLNLGKTGNVIGSGDGLQLFGDLYGSGKVEKTTIAGDVYVGNSPGKIIMDQVKFSSNSTLFMELAGTGEAGVDYDQIIFSGGDLDLAGVTLSLSLLQGFTPLKDNTFQTFDFDLVTIVNTFENILLPELAQNLIWDSSKLYTQGILDVNSVPIPPSLWLMASGLFMILLMGKRNQLTTAK